MTGPVAALFFATCGTVLAVGNPGLIGTQALVVACTVLPAFYLATVGSAHLLPYVLTLYLVGPEVRRVVDWSGDTYTSVTLISLIPMLANLTMVMPVVREWQRIPRSMQIPLSLMFGACAYASALGLVLHGQAAIPEAMGWTTPLLVLAYLSSRRADTAERTEWLWAFLAISVGVSVYTWIQFVTAPPWDMQWLVESGMTSSMGQPKPLEFRAFGSLNSTGTAGFYFPFVIAAVWTARTLRNSLGVVAAMFAASALLITQVRAGWLMTAAMLVAGTVVRDGGSKLRQIGGLTAIVSLLIVLFPFLPGNEHVQDRFQSFGDLQSDTSAQARASTTESLLGQIALDPMGTGFGQSAEEKVSGSSTQVTGIDNGFAAIAVDFGWCGALMFFAAIGLLGRLVMVDTLPRSPAGERGTANPLVTLRRLSIASLVGMLVGTAAFAAFGGVVGVVGWMLFGLRFCPTQPERR